MASGKGTWADNFHQFLPYRGARPTYPTELNIQYNNDYLYVAIRALTENPEKFYEWPGDVMSLQVIWLELHLTATATTKPVLNFTMTAWGMHSWRWISCISEESDWEQQTKNGPGMLYNFGELRGIEGLKKSRFRVDLNITPEFSFQYYGSPFVSRGSFSGLKYITDPGAKVINDRFRIYDNAS
jgi:hypothetical protein